MAASQARKVWYKLRLIKSATNMLMECEIEPATHQIRVHMASIHHPILGIQFMARQDSFNLGQASCWLTRFIHPSTKYVEFKLLQLILLTR